MSLIYPLYCAGEAFVVHLDNRHITCNETWTEDRVEWRPADQCLEPVILQPCRLTVWFVFRKKFQNGHILPILEHTLWQLAILKHCNWLFLAIIRWTSVITRCFPWHCIRQIIWTTKLSAGQTREWIGNYSPLSQPMNTQIIVRNFWEQQGHVVLLISLIHVDDGIQAITG